MLTFSKCCNKAYQTSGRSSPVAGGIHFPELYTFSPTFHPGTSFMILASSSRYFFHSLTNLSSSSAWSIGNIALRAAIFSSLSARRTLFPWPTWYMPHAKAPKAVRKMAVALGPEVGIRRAYRTGANPPGGGPSCTTGISLTLAIPGLFRTMASVILAPRSGRRAARLQIWSSPGDQALGLGERLLLGLGG
uniref:Uncharacterized protein n=1 Tax=Arundo donax TaxID=35708 RepID=A0A0A9E0Y7_ARUDO